MRKEAFKIVLLLEYVFWLLIIVIVYIYLGYPALSFVYARIKEKPIIKDDNFFPSVTLIISAFNEEKVIEKKLHNTLKIDYPKSKLEVMVVSDGSTDKTNDIVRQFNQYGIRLVEYKINRGKTACQNDTAKLASGEILVFSDANAIYLEDSIEKIVRNFKDPKIGCVCGELRYKEDVNADSQGEGLYWRFEQFLKKTESKIGNVLGANGSIYAVRKKLYIPLANDIISDFVEPLKVINQGYRAVYEPRAISYEYSSRSYRSEFRRKVRIINRSYRGLISVKCLLNPFRQGFLAIGLLSHKLLRWYAWFFLLLILIINIILVFTNHKLYLVILLMQFLFYLLALVGFYSKKPWKPLQIPTYFCLVNYASFIGLFKYHTGDSVITWKPDREMTY